MVFRRERDTWKVDSGGQRVRLADSDPVQRTMLVAPPLVESSTTRAMLALGAPNSTRNCGAGVVRRGESESAIHGLGRARSLVSREGGQAPWRVRRFGLRHRIRFTAAGGSEFLCCSTTSPPSVCSNFSLPHLIRTPRSCNALPLCEAEVEVLIRVAAEVGSDGTSARCPTLRGAEGPIVGTVVKRASEVRDGVEFRTDARCARWRLSAPRPIVDLAILGIRLWGRHSSAQYGPSTQ